jgi:hypothetical protein
MMMKRLLTLMFSVMLTACTVIPTSVLPAKSGATAATATATTRAAGNAVDPAIQAVIQRANNEQVDAFTRNNPSLMQDTATTSYYQELVQLNQDLATNGVTAIKLVNLDWGPIVVQSPTLAQATTFESWQTTYSDGHTEVQDRERNVYTLVQENGSWKIQSDGHPDSQLNQSGPGTPVATPGSETPAATPSPFPNVPGLRPDQSRNWSGYAATGGTFTAVTGTWVVPKSSGSPTASSGRGANVAGDATWVGIGGVRGRDLIQAGTEARVVGPGDTVYDAWIELLPQASQTVPLTVAPGDSITIAITDQGSGFWLIAFTNNTTGKQYQATEQYTSSHSSAEWIEEAPSGGRRLVPLDNFGTVRFSGGSAVEDGKTVTIAQAKAQPVTMIDRNEQPLAMPSNLGSDGSSFSVSRS